MKKSLSPIYLIVAIAILISSCTKNSVLNQSDKDVYAISHAENSTSAPAFAPEDMEASIVPSPKLIVNLPSVNEEKIAEEVFHETNLLPKEQLVTNTVTTPTETITKKELRKSVKQVKKDIRNELKNSEVERTGIGTLLLVIIAILLPPLAVFLVDGLSGPFWLSILLTLLLYVPGIIYALYRVFRAENNNS